MTDGDASCMRNLRKFVSLLMALVMVFSLCCAGVSAAEIEYKDENGKTVELDDFLDTSGHWAHDVILRWADYEIIGGYQGNFYPNSSITRGDMAVVLDRMLGLDDTTYNYFVDLRSTEYFTDSILRCVAYGYLNGISANEMAPRSYVTREQFAAILCRVFHLSAPGYTLASTGLTDAADVSGWAAQSVATVYRWGYMKGTPGGNFNPQSSITRAELIQALSNVAGAFIPKKGTAVTSFKDNFPQNILTGKAITLNKSVVGRDVFVTSDAGSFTMSDSEIAGRLVLMGKTSVSMDTSSVGQIVLLNGKSTISGITSATPSVYVAYDATESTLDDIPATLVLESGARVIINGTTYENDSLVSRTYYGLDIKNDIAEVQGYVSGGAKISGTTFTQSVENKVTVSKVNINPGESPITEVGVVWVYQDDAENDILPTYQNADGRMKYTSDKLDTTLSFDVGTVKDTCTYRLYARDAAGLYAYSGVQTFTEYDFDVYLSISDTAANEYPNKVAVEMVFSGENIPELGSVKVTYGTSGVHYDSQPSVSMKQYVAPNAEYTPDETKYQKYTGTITSTKNGDGVIVPPTYFGYIISFDDGSIWNRFPVLSNKIPAGANPVAAINLGNASVRTYTTLSVADSVVTAGYADIAEAGLMYYVGKSQPSLGSSSWTKVDTVTDLPIGQSYVFDSIIPLPENEDENVYFVLFARTAVGYKYSDVSYYSGAWLGDEGASQLWGGAVTVLTTDAAVVTLLVDDGEDIDDDCVLITSATRDGVTDASLAGKKLRDFTYHVSDPVDGVRTVYVFLEGLKEKCAYRLGMQLVDDDGLATNMSNVAFSTTLDRLMDITLGEQYASAYPGWVAYDVTFGSEAVRLRDAGSLIYGDIDGVSSVMTTDGSVRAQRTVYVAGVDDYSTTIVDLACVYTIPSTSKKLEFIRAVHLG